MLHKGRSILFEAKTRAASNEASGEAAASEQFVDIRMSTNRSFAATSIFLPLHDLIDEGVDEGMLQCAWMTSNATEVKPSKPLLLSVSETCTQTEEQSLPGPQGNTWKQRPKHPV